MRKGCEIGEILNKKGQVTIFIIVAVLIVAVGILIYFLFPGFKSIFSTQIKNPNEFIQSCLQDKIKETATTLGLQGGSLDPEHYLLYKNNKVGYLCYTGEYYKTCVMQQPMLQQHIESEIQNTIKSDVDSCFNSLVKDYQNKGYQVTLEKNNYSVELVPQKISVTFNYPLKLTKDTTQTYDSISISVNNNLYELTSIANSILNWEARYGDAETTTYMGYYPNIKVEKWVESEGSKVYTITDRKTGDKLIVASRSVAWPPGYGISDALA